MASTSAPAARTVTVVECAECDVDQDVHELDGCAAPRWQHVQACGGCFERPDRCDC